MNLKHQNPNPKPQTPNHKPQTPNHKPHTSNTGMCPLRAATISAVMPEARHTSHFTRHTSHVTLHTSHVTRHTSIFLIFFYLVSILGGAALVTLLYFFNILFRFTQFMFVESMNSTYELFQEYLD
jgi:hypothetical protein